MDKEITKIWTEVLKGNQEAWNRLILKYASLVYSVARRVGLDRFDAEDCSQHTWMTLYRYRKSLKDPTRLPVWLIRTTHRQAIYMSRRQARRAEVDYEAQPKLSEVLTDKEIESIEWRVALDTAMKKLDPRCRRLIAGLFLESDELTYKEMARELKISSNALGPMRSRCLKRLRVILENLGYELH